MPVLKKPGFTRLQERLRGLMGPDAPVPVPRPDKPVLDPSHWLGDRPEYLGSGLVSDVWGNDQWVAKIGKEVIPEAHLMPSRDNEKRQALAEQTLEVIESLRMSPEFARFSHLLPPTFIPAPFVIVQKRAYGVQLKDLDQLAKLRAEEFRSAIWRAAQCAVPGVEIDVNPDHVYFDSEGNPTAFLDPAGILSWAASWNPGNPPGRDIRQGAQVIIARRMEEQGGSTFQTRGGLVEVAGSYALRVTGDAIAFGDALLVGNVEKNSAFLVKYRLCDAYVSRSFDVTCGEKLSNVLGLPVDEQRESPKDPGRWVQHFQHGMMTWSQSDGVQVRIRPDLPASISLIQRRLAEEGWKTIGPIEPIAGGYGRRVRRRSLQFGDAYLIANPERGRAFVVKNAFRYAYTSVLFPESKLRPLYEVLGLPTDDERELPGSSIRLVQEFQHGQLTIQRPSRGLSHGFVAKLNRAGAFARSIFELAIVRRAKTNGRSGANS